MLTVVIGAAGFVGQAVVAQMRANRYPGTVRLLDRAPVATSGEFESHVVDLLARENWAPVVDGATRILHLAALPGGASEADPRQSRSLNLDVTLDLIEVASRLDARLVVASSIAVFGVPLPAQVDDATPALPSMTYGTHKRMAELALADGVRRGTLNAIALRLPGIVARPGPSAGFKSAFLNDLFWAMQDGMRLTVPVSPTATNWLMSVRQCAANLVHALALPAAEPVVTLPALRVRIDALVAAIAHRVGGDANLIDYAPEPELEAQFGAYPPLITTAADKLGFRHDGDLESLVTAALSPLDDKEPAVEVCQ